MQTKYNNALFKSTQFKFKKLSYHNHVKCSYAIIRNIRKRHQLKCGKIDSTLVLYDNVIYAVYLGINYQKDVVKFGHLKLFF